MEERCSGSLCAGKESEDRNPAQPEHECPYRVEVNDSHFPCDCCDACRRLCMEEI